MALDPPQPPDDLHETLALRCRQLAEVWGVSAGQARTMLGLLAERLPEYSELEFIGAGGMGEVWRAVHQTLQRAVAIKLITPDAQQDPGFTERFLREARILAD